MPALHFLPPPRRLSYGRGSFALVRAARIMLPDGAGPAAIALARRIADEIAGRCASHLALPVTGTEAAITCAQATGPAQGYTLATTRDQVTLTANDDAGLFYGLNTLLQIVRQCQTELPALRIVDAPDYPVRGFYHDVARGKVPTRATLFALVEKMAHYKLNQLQLYVEHTFAFRRHPELWAGSDPLTAEDITALDDHCARHHIELVPSLSTFGHFYTALVSPRHQHLNELPLDGSALPFSWWDRMGHYTLDCRNPESLGLVRELIHELRPLFRSKFFNIGCDETFDLGRGRNAALAARRGPGRLYLDFLRQIMAAVRSAGAVPMFWGDIVGNHPELVGRVPRGAIALDWDYSADLHDTKSALFRRARRPFYVCPVCAGWDRWINDLDTATANILAFARRGRRTGSTGLLNTDWGDRGHINALGNSYHGLLLGAAASWNTRSTTPATFDAAFNALEMGDPTQSCARLLREIGSASVIPWKQLVLWFDPSPHRPAEDWNAESGLPAALFALEPATAFAAYEKITRLGTTLARVAATATPQDPLALREALVGARGQALMQALGGHLLCFAKRQKPPRAPTAAWVADELRRFEADVSAVWHARNRPSEYFRVRQALLEFARRLDRFALGLPVLPTVRGGG